MGHTKTPLRERLIALLCALAMLVSYVPTAAFAEAPGQTVIPAGKEQQEQNGQQKQNELPEQNTQPVENGQLPEQKVQPVQNAAARQPAAETQNIPLEHTSSPILLPPEPSSLTAADITDITAGSEGSEIELVLDDPTRGSKELSPAVTPTPHDGDTTEWTIEPGGEDFIELSGDEGTDTRTVTAKAKGTATVKVASKNDAGVACTYTITVKEPVKTVTVTPSEYTLAYGDTVKLTAAVDPADAADNTVEWSVEETEKADAVTLMPDPVNNNSVTVTANKVSETVTVKATAGGKSAACTIHTVPKTITVTKITASKVYDGSKTVSTDSPEFALQAELKGVKAGEESGVSLEKIAFDDLADPKAGEYQNVGVDYTYAVLTGTASGNYVLDQDAAHNVSAATVTVKKKELTGALQGTHIYTAQDKYSGLTLTLDGLVASDGLPAEISGVIATSGTAPKLTVTENTATLDYSAADIKVYETNYELPETAKLTLTPAPLRVTVSAATRQYNGTTTADLTAAITPEDILGSDDVTAEATEGAFDSADAGTRNISGELSLSGADADNYEYVATWQQGTIEKNSNPDNVKVDVLFEPQVVGDTTLKVYIRCTNTIDNTPLKGTADVSYTVDENPGTPQNGISVDKQGTYVTIDLGASATSETVAVTVTFTVDGSEPNFTGTFTGTNTYNTSYQGLKVTSTLIGSDANITYGEEKTLKSLYNIAVTDLADAPVSEYKLVYASLNTAAAVINAEDGTIEVKNVANAGADGTVAFTVQAVATGTEGYNASIPVECKVTLQKKALPALTLKCANKTYDGYNDAAVESITIDTSTIPAEDKAAFEGEQPAFVQDGNAGPKNFKATFAQVNAGTDLTVTAADVTLAAGIADNYTFSNGSDTVDITGTAAIDRFDLKQGELKLTYDEEASKAMYYTAEAREPEMTVTVTLREGDGPVTLTADDYEVTYAGDRTTLGTETTVTVTGKGNYQNTLSDTFTIKYKPIAPSERVLTVNEEDDAAPAAVKTYPADDTGTNTWWYNHRITFKAETGYTICDGDALGGKTPENSDFKEVLPSYGATGDITLTGKTIYAKETAGPGYIGCFTIQDTLKVDKTAPVLTKLEETTDPGQKQYDDGFYYNKPFTVTFTIREENCAFNTPASDPGNNAYEIRYGSTASGSLAKVDSTVAYAGSDVTVTVTVDPTQTTNGGKIPREEHQPYVYLRDPAGNVLAAEPQDPNMAVTIANGTATCSVKKIADTVEPTAVITYTALAAEHYKDKNAYYNSKAENGALTATFTYGDESQSLDETKLYKSVTVDGGQYASADTHPANNGQPSIVDTIVIPATDANNGRYQFGAWGTDKAGNALHVTETQVAPAGQPGSENVIAKVPTKAEWKTEAWKIIDTVNPVATLKIDAPGTLRPERQTYYGNRYYFNVDFTATVTITELNFEAGKVRVLKGHENHGGATFQSQNVTAGTPLSGPEDKNPSWVYNETFNTDGVYVFSLVGVDLAGNPVVLDGDLEGNFIETQGTDRIGSDPADLYTSFKVVRDTAPPVVDMAMRDANNNGNLSNPAGNFHEANFTKNGESVNRQISTNYPYRSSQTADVSVAVTDTSPATVTYTINSTIAGKTLHMALEGAEAGLGKKGVMPDRAYAAALTDKRSVAAGEQVLQLAELTAEDLAGNSMHFAADPNTENRIYLDVTAPTDDELAPTVRLAHPEPVAQNTMSGRPISGVDLYNSSIAITASILDPYTMAGFQQGARGSGLYRVYYQVTVNGSDVTADVNVQAANGKGNGADANGVYISYGTTGQEDQVMANETLVPEDTLTFTFDPSGDSIFNNNAITLTVWAVDNAANGKEKQDLATYEFGIDSTAPTILITYDNNSAENEKYFKADRTATVQVTERNFDPAAIVITTQSENISDWSYASGAKANGDDDTWTCTIGYTVDGPYTLEINGADQLGNQASSIVYEGVQPQDFVIDKTLPVVSVTFDNNDVRNGRYYNRSRTATIAVTDVNFSGVNDISVTAEVGGVAPAPAFSDRTAVLPFHEDGTYSFRGTVTDMAGNVSAEFSADPFVIDQTAPELVIEGVEDATAYAAEVTPRIIYSDQNYEGYTMSLVRTVLNEHNVDVSDLIVPDASSQPGADGYLSGTVTYEDIEHVPENDGIYTLSAQATDYAGNTTEQSVTYSVNRFGSVYVYSDALVDMMGAYRQQANDKMYIQAYNVTPLVEDSVHLQITCDGAMLADQATVARAGADPAIGSSGWYEYRFDIAGEDLEADGRYEIQLSDVDTAGNTKTNADDPIWFYIDTTKPSLDSIVGLEEPIVNADEQTVSYTASDAIALDSIFVYVNGQEVSHSSEFESPIYSDSFAVGSGLRQSIRLVVTDKAGNVLDTDDEAFTPSYVFNRMITVSTNFFIRWYANTYLFWGSIGLAGVAVAAPILILVAKRRKKETAEQS